MKLQIGKNICHITFHQCVQIKPHLFSLTNLESYTSSFCQSLQIYCREEQREGKNDSSRAFCVTSKYNKKRKTVKIVFWINVYFYMINV